MDHGKRGTGGDRIAVITKELASLGAHIKTYNAGAYPVFCLQTHTILRVPDILEMRLADISQYTGGTVRIRTEIAWGDRVFLLNEDVRRELAWYIMQRIQVKGTPQKCLDEMHLCVNKQGNPLQPQVYRKMLERTCDELGLSRIYNSQYLRSLYGYLEIAYGRKTIDDVAREYQVERYYLLTRIFHGVGIEYESSLIDEVASIDAPEGGDKGGAPLV